MTPPKRLKGDAKRKWNEVFIDFSPASPLDTELACQYCETWANYVTAQKIVDTAPSLVVEGGKNGAPYQHPAVSMMNKASERMERIYKLLKDKLTKTDSKPFDDLESD